CTGLASILSIAHAQSVSLSAARRSDGQMQVTVWGSSPSPVTLQASSDLKNWQDLQTFSISGGPVVLGDTEAANHSHRTYRVRDAVAAPTQLPDLASLMNRVFPAPEGFNTIQYAANGTLGFIVW